MLYINRCVSISFSYKLMRSLLQISNSFLKFWLKTGKHSKVYRGVNIDESAMCYISMDLSLQVLQTNENLFLNFGIIFQIESFFGILNFFSNQLQFFEIMWCWVYACKVRKAFVLTSTRSSL